MNPSGNSHHGHRGSWTEGVNFPSANIPRQNNNNLSPQGQNHAWGHTQGQGGDRGGNMGDGLLSDESRLLAMLSGVHSSTQSWANAPAGQAGQIQASELFEIEALINTVAPLADPPTHTNRLGSGGLNSNFAQPRYTHGRFDEMSHLSSSLQSEHPSNTHQSHPSRRESFPHHNRDTLQSERMQYLSVGGMGGVGGGVGGQNMHGGNNLSFADDHRRRRSSGESELGGSVGRLQSRESIHSDMSPNFPHRLSGGSDQMFLTQQLPGPDVGVQHFSRNLMPQNMHPRSNSLPSSHNSSVMGSGGVLGDSDMQYGNTQAHHQNQSRSGLFGVGSGGSLEGGSSPGAHSPNQISGFSQSQSPLQVGQVGLGGSNVARGSNLQKFGSPTSASNLSPLQVTPKLLQPQSQHLVQKKPTDSPNSMASSVNSSSSLAGSVGGSSRDLVGGLEGVRKGAGQSSGPLRGGTSQGLNSSEVQPKIAPATSNVTPVINRPPTPTTRPLAPLPPGGVAGIRPPPPLAVPLVPRGVPPLPAMRPPVGNLSDKTESHKASEHRSRLRLRDNLQDLVSMVPALQAEKGTSKAAVLQKATDHVNLVKKHNATLKREVGEKSRVVTELQSQAEQVNREVQLTQAHTIELLDPDLKYIFVDFMWELVMGYKSHEVHGQISLDLTLDDCPLMERCAVEIAEALKAGSSWSGTVMGQRKDKTWFACEMSISPVRDPISNQTTQYACTRKNFHLLNTETLPDLNIPTISEADLKALEGTTPLPAVQALLYARTTDESVPIRLQGTSSPEIGS